MHAKRISAALLKTGSFNPVIGCVFRRKKASEDCCSSLRIIIVPRETFLLMFEADDSFQKMKAGSLS